MEVIKDLQVDITGDVLESLCHKQAKFHADRVKFWQSHYDKVESNQIPPETEDENEDPLAGFSNSYSSKARVSFEDMKKSQLTQIRLKVLEHQNAADELEFIATYAKPAQEYRVGAAEMRKLGITK